MRVSKAIIIFVLAFDLILIALHFLLGDKSDFFDLDSELNLPTIFQGLKLVSLGGLSLTLYILYRYFGYATPVKNKFSQDSEQKNRKKLFFTLSWLFLAVMFWYIGVDEVGVIHENSPTIARSFLGGSFESYLDFWRGFGFRSTEWLTIYAPIMAVAIPILGLITFSFFKNYGKRAYLFGLGLLLFAVVPLAELIGTGGYDLSYENYRFIVSIEEGSEMIGASLFMVFAILTLREILAGKLSRQN